MPRPKKEKPNHAGGLYEVKITVDKIMSGKPIRKSFYSSISKEDARRKAEEWKIERQVAERSGDVFVQQDPEFSQWAYKWLNTYVKGKVKDNSYSSSYEIPVRRHIAPYFQSRRLSEIHPIDIQTFLDEKSKDLSAETAKKLRRCLNKIFETAIENHLCRHNPVTSNIKIKKPPKPKEKRFYTFEQRDMIVEYAKTHPFGLPIILMLYTGISRSELLGLKWEDITPDCTVHVRRGITDEKSTATGRYRLNIGDEAKTEYRTREIPILPWIYEMIAAKPKTITLGGSVRNKTPERIVETEFIFHNTLGGPQSPHNFYYYVYLPFMRDMVAHFQKNNIEIPALTPHELRHTAATLWALSGVDLYAISKLGGWSDLKMLSKVYGHSEVETLRQKLGYS